MDKNGERGKKFGLVWFGLEKSGKKGEKRFGLEKKGKKVEKRFPYIWLFVTGLSVRK